MPGSGKTARIVPRPVTNMSDIIEKEAILAVEKMPCSPNTLAEVRLTVSLCKVAVFSTVSTVAKLCRWGGWHY